MVLPMNAQAGATVFRVSTDTMPARHRVAIWREEFAREFLRLDIEPRDPESFRADATIRMMPGLKIASCDISASHWRRTRRLVGMGVEEVGIMFGWHGPATLVQRGRSFELGFGDAAACLNSEPADLTLPCPKGRHIGLVVPLARLAGSLRDRDPIPRRIPGSDQAIRLLLAYLGTLRDDATLANPELRQAVVFHIHDLIALALGASGDAAEIATRRGLRAARLRAIKADVRANLASAELSVAIVARRQGITPRYLHMLFEDEGSTFSRFLLGERLDLACRMLGDPRHDCQSIAAVAYAAGFGDLSYFNRTFRSRYHATPREIRKQAGCAS